MKITCPCCKNQLIIADSRKDHAEFTEERVYTTAEYADIWTEKLLAETEARTKKDAEDQLKKKLVEDFEKYKIEKKFKLHTIAYWTIVFMLFAFVFLLTAYMFVTQFPQAIDDFWPSLFGIILSGATFLAGASRIEGYERKIKEKFLKIHPEYEELS